MRLRRYLPKKELLSIVILLILSIPVVLPLLHPGFFVTDDGEWMIIRFTAFHQAFLDGQFPVRWLGRLNSSYGYPAADFMYPGFMYLGEFFRLVHVGYVMTIKLILGISLLSSGVFTFLWLRKRFSVLAAFVGGVLYVYAPYHLFDLYQRGSVGEVLSLAIIPFILWSMEINSLALTSVGVGALILSHNSLAALFLPIICFYYVFHTEKLNQKRFISLVIVLLLSLGLSAFFWIPALYDLQYTVFSQTAIANLGSYFKEPKIHLLQNLIYLLIGICAVSSPFLYRAIKKESQSGKILGYFFFVILLVSLFFNLSISLPLWSFLPISFIQFPFRLLSLEILSVSFLAAWIITSLKGKSQYVTSTLLFILFSFPIFIFVTHITYTNKGDDFYATNEDTTTIKNEYMPSFAKVFTTHPDTIIGENIEVKDVIKKSNKISFTTSVDKTQKITINQLYFPGWKVEVNNKETPLNNDKTGRISFTIPKGQNIVVARFTETPVRLMSDIISLISLLILCVILIKEVKVAYETYKK